MINNSYFPARFLLSCPFFVDWCTTDSSLKKEPKRQATVLYSANYPFKKQKPPWFAAADCCKIERKAIYIYSPERLLYTRYTRKTKSISESDLLLFLTRKNTH
jgi:hypothetical protein